MFPKNSTATNNLFVKDTCKGYEILGSALYVENRTTI